MIVAKKAAAPSWYTSRRELNNPNPTQFKLRELDGVESQDVGMFRDRRGHYDMDADAVRAALTAGLVDWKNFIDEAGQPIEFDRIDPLANIRRFDKQLCAELALEIFVRSTFSEEERKNLSSQLTSPITATNSSAEPAPGADTAMNQTEPQSSNGSSQA